MGQNEVHFSDNGRSRLLEAARTLVLAGDSKFSIGSLCAQAGVERSAFQAHFSGRTALMAALMQESPAQGAVPVAPVPAEDNAFPPAAPEAGVPKPVSDRPPHQNPKSEPEPSVTTPDAWLERRLRVFERALSALEAKAEATVREHARQIEDLEERLGRLDSTPTERRMESRPVVLAASQPGAIADKQPTPVLAVMSAETSVLPEPGAGEPPQADTRPAPEFLAVMPPPVVTLSKEEMADVLQSARDKARAAAAKIEVAPPDTNNRVRWLAIGALSLVLLFLCIGLILGNTAGARDGQLAQWQGSGVTHRHVAQGSLERTVALADFGDSRAQARLALDYLRGQGVTSDAQAALRWSAAAARAGQPVAQYLLGSLYQPGSPIPADPTRAFAWFAAAAARGNLKAMHNLAIAYDQGQGTPKDAAKAARWFERAAERGYVDSAFDLAVLYERGEGVPQDPAQALKWYGIAARSGDGPSKERAQFLEGQLNAVAVKLALNAAEEFAPIKALEEANSL
jgi:TPR repeat protein